MSIFFYYNGKFFREGSKVISPHNRSFKYGDGLFETMKIIDGKLILPKYHFERLFYGMKILEFEVPSYFTGEYLEKKILELSKKNKHDKITRTRLTVSRGSGGLYDAENNIPEYIIQTWSLPKKSELNTNGLIIDVYPSAKKSCDVLANLKTNNFLVYVMAAIHAKKNKLNDCIVLNNYDNLCDTTIANIFIIKKGIVYTPPLSEGCIAGIMRRWLLEKLENYIIIEKPITVDELSDADEVFLTNSIFTIKWVKQFRDIKYNNTLTANIYKAINQTF